MDVTVSRFDEHEVEIFGFSYRTMSSMVLPRAARFGCYSGRSAGVWVLFVGLDG